MTPIIVHQTNQIKWLNTFICLTHFSHLLNKGTHLGSTSEACLALAHSHDIINYTALEPQSLQQH